MSEYQYYEFLAVDRPLTKAEIAQVRALSTRARITSTSFVNEYHWGDFHGDPAKLVEQLYDAHLYYANWGSRRLLLRIPASVLPAKTAQGYALQETLAVWTRGGHTLLDFSLSAEDGGEWDFETSFELASFAGLRAELAAGDLRPLYLGWLAAIAVWELADDDEEEYRRETEPSVPAGLAELTGPQRALADFLRVPQDLLAVAASNSAPATESAAATDRLAAFIAGLPAPEKDTLLLQAALGTAPQLGPGLLARFRQSLRPSEGSPGARRSAAQLLDAAHRHRTVSAQRERAARGAAEQARVRAVAEARDARLDHLARDQATAWRTVDDLIAQRKPAAYDQAVALLSDLRALHARQGSAADFDRRFGELRTAHRGKPSLMRRFDALGFPNP
ncbi:hypothetical protein OG819_43835 [Streptomyces sp. NBC_01549]|uniref:hypothetical protein n=1 Tax=Streptomyces sp. NBC_01549 TaxID=2975874 RepID=UPI00225C11C4|nr:hypothetical protein [Streptomyces sp. NBC_01549]MCX4596341.1 hypothetical protein [Streptomyces sp. NBC_01549]